MTLSVKLVGAAAAIAGAAALTVTLLSAHTGTYHKMLWLGGPSGSGNINPGPVSTSWVFGSFDPCVDGGPVTVTGFKFSKSSGLVLTDWGYQVNHHSGTGVHPGTVQSSGLQHGPVTITNLCSDTKANRASAGGNFGDLFAVVAHRTTGGSGWSSGLDVTYRSGGKSHKSHWPLGFALCGNTPLPRDDLLTGLCKGR